MNPIPEATSGPTPLYDTLRANRKATDRSDFEEQLAHEAAGEILDAIRAAGFDEVAIACRVADKLRVMNGREVRASWAEFFQKV